MPMWIPEGPVAINDSYWRGFVSGQVFSLAISSDFDGNGTSALFLGTGGGGIWRSQDFSTATPIWTPLTDSLALPPGSQGTMTTITSLAVDPKQTQTIYAGWENVGIYI